MTALFEHSPWVEARAVWNRGQDNTLEQIKDIETRLPFALLGLDSDNGGEFLNWALHGHRWVKVKVKRIVHKLDVNTLAEQEADHLEPNGIGHVELSLQEPLATLPHVRSRALGALVLVDTATHKTAGAVLVR